MLFEEITDNYLVSNALLNWLTSVHSGLCRFIFESKVSKNSLTENYWKSWLRSEPYGMGEKANHVHTRG